MLFRSKKTVVKLERYESPVQRRHQQRIKEAVQGTVKDEPGTSMDVDTVHPPGGFTKFAPEVKVKAEQMEREASRKRKQQMEREAARMREQQEEDRRIKQFNRRWDEDNSKYQDQNLDRQELDRMRRQGQNPPRHALLARQMPTVNPPQRQHVKTERRDNSWEDAWEMWIDHVKSSGYEDVDWKAVYRHKDAGNNPPERGNDYPRLKYEMKTEDALTAFGKLTTGTEQHTRGPRGAQQAATDDPSKTTTIYPESDTAEDEKTEYPKKKKPYSWGTGKTGRTAKGGKTTKFKAKYYRPRLRGGGAPDPDDEDPSEEESSTTEDARRRAYTRRKLEV